MHGKGVAKIPERVLTLEWAGIMMRRWPSTTQAPSANV
jgi:hypothetical protein